MKLSRDKIKELEHTATLIREDIIEMLLAAGSGHSAGPLGLADIFTALYFSVLKHNPKKPLWPARDRLFLSCGHTCPVLYAAMAHAGYFPRKELTTLRKINSRLQGHPHRGSLPGIETTTGPLGQGLSVAVGAALAAKLKKETHQIFCVSSDGEQEEGMVWEALMMANKHRLGNFTVILDRNFIQIDGTTEDVMPLEPLSNKYRAFGFLVREINGHDFNQIVTACEESRQGHRPTVIIAHTIPGKGVSFMENDYRWHGATPNSEQAQEALQQLRSLDGAIVGAHE